MLNRFFHCCMNSFHAHSINSKRRHLERPAEFVKVSHIARAFYGSPHRIIVILNHEDDRQRPGHGHVQCFMKCTLSYCAITHVADAYVFCAFVFFSKCNPGAEWNLSADNAMPAEEPEFGREHVHGSSFAF